MCKMYDVYDGMCAYADVIQLFSTLPPFPPSSQAHHHNTDPCSPVTERPPPPTGKVMPTKLQLNPKSRLGGLLKPRNGRMFGQQQTRQEGPMKAEVCALGTSMFSGYLHVCALGTSMCSGYLHVLWVPPCALGTSMCSGYLHVLWVPPNALGTSMCSGYLHVLWVPPCALGTSMCSGYLHVLWVPPCLYLKMIVYFTNGVRNLFNYCYEYNSILMNN